MRNIYLKSLLTPTVIAAIILSAARLNFTQQPQPQPPKPQPQPQTQYLQCFSSDDVKRMAQLIETAPETKKETTSPSQKQDQKQEATKQQTQPQSQPDNPKLRDELLDLKIANIERFTGSIKPNLPENGLNKTNYTPDEKDALRFCEILREQGWLTENLVGKDGVSAAYYLLRNYLPVEAQMALLPVIEVAVRRGLNEKNEDYAAFIDRLRLRAGMKQLFGTQTRMENGFLVLYPLQSEKQVDEWRAQYKMMPLKEYLRLMEIKYRKPIIKQPPVTDERFMNFADSSPVSNPERREVRLATENLVESSDGNSTIEKNAVSTSVVEEQNEIIRVDSSLVSLDVIVYSDNRKAPIGELEAKDFHVIEDGREQEISYFARSEMPFDLVLVIDLSGSTANKINLIRNSTRSFIEAKRPSDRLAIVTFSTDVQIVTPLTDDTQKLLNAAKDIKGRGSSYVWDALNFTLNKVIGQKTPERRRAVVFMTDGADNSLLYMKGVGSKTLYADLLENVRRSETTIIPIYLDTERDNLMSGEAYADARRMLWLLAQSSGGLYYKAQKIDDLDGVYNQVLNDLSKVYSLGYTPKNEKRDGTWRTLKVEIPNRTDLKTQTKAGYYAK